VPTEYRYGPIESIDGDLQQAGERVKRAEIGRVSRSSAQPSQRRPGDAHRVTLQEHLLLAPEGTQQILKVLFCLEHRRKALSSPHDPNTSPGFRVPKPR
jgi:hypothetical protein